MGTFESEYATISGYLLTSLATITDIAKVVNGDLTRSNVYTTAFDKVAFFGVVDMPVNNPMATVNHWATYQVVLRVGIALKSTAANGEDIDKFAHRLWDWLGYEWTTGGLRALGYDVEIYSPNQEQRIGSDYQAVSYRITLRK